MSHEAEQYRMWTDQEVKGLTKKAAMVGFVYGILCTITISILFFIFMEGVIILD